VQFSQAKLPVKSVKIFIQPIAKFLGFTNPAFKKRPKSPTPSTMNAHKADLSPVQAATSPRSPAPSPDPDDGSSKRQATR
jgi:hypothetical protein